jgi:predicted nucleic acid-binding protein
MNPKVYVESSVVSYLANRDSRDIVVLAQQQITREWWIDAAKSFDLYVSDLVIDEVSRGASDAANARVQAVAKASVLSLDAEVQNLAARLLKSAALPQKAEDDALHIAVATANGMDFLLTWNCTHIANARTREIIIGVCRAAGYEPPVICTPAELQGR